MQIENHKLKQDMIFLLGQLTSLCYPLIWESENECKNSGYYDLIDSINAQYLSILKRTVGYEE